MRVGGWLFISEGNLLMLDRGRDEDAGGAPAADAGGCSIESGRILILLGQWGFSRCAGMDAA